MKRFVISTVLLVSLVFQNNLLAHNNHRYSEYIEFTENNITFYVYRDGTFDFKIHDYENSRDNELFTSVSTPYFSFNYRQYGQNPSTAYVRYDRYGNIRQIGNVYINYDYQGRLISIGNVEIYFHGDYVTSIGHASANYGFYKRYHRPHHVYYAPQATHVYKTNYSYQVNHQHHRKDFERKGNNHHDYRDERSQKHMRERDRGNNKSHRN